MAQIGEDKRATSCSVDQCRTASTMAVAIVSAVPDHTESGGGAGCGAFSKDLSTWFLGHLHLLPILYATAFTSFMEYVAAFYFQYMHIEVAFKMGFKRVASK